jgi:hypothetical protein
MRKHLSKAKYLLYIPGLLFLGLYIFVLLLLKSPSFQTVVSSHAAAWLSEELNAPVKVGSVDLSPFFLLKLGDVMIGDQKGDTIAYIPLLTVYISELSIAKKTIGIGNISLYDPVIKAIRDEDSIPRYQFLITYFGGDTTETDSSGWKLTLKSFDLHNAFVIYQKLPVQPKPWGINYRDIQISSLSLMASGFESDADTFRLKIRNLSMFEKSGIAIRTLFADITIEPEKIRLDNFFVRTPGSAISMSELSFRFNSLEDFDQFEENVRIQAKLNPSQIDFRDAGYFSSYLKGLDEKILISGDIKGKISSLRGKNIFLSIRKKTRLHCDFSIDGLPDAEAAFWHFDFHRFTTSMEEISDLPIPPFNENVTLNLPSEAIKFGNISYKGKFSGFTTDFVAFGSFKTSLGELGSDASLKQSADGKTIHLKGRLWSNSIMAGQLAGVPEEIGNAGFAVSADGVINKNGTYKMTLKGDISHIRVRDYLYTNLVLNGVVTDKTFDGELHADDPNVKLDFFGKVDFSEKIPVYDFSCALEKCYFSRLHLFGNDSLARISVNINARISGNDVDNLNGLVSLSEISYRSSKNILNANSIEISSAQGEAEKEIIIRSDIADVTLTGNFSFKTIADASTQFLADYFPSLQKKNNDPKLLKQMAENPSYIDFDIYTGKVNSFLKEFIPGLNIAENSRIKGHMDFSQRSLEFDATSLKVSMDETEFSEIDFTGNAAEGLFRMEGNIGNLKQGESFSARDIIIGINGHTDTCFVDLGWDRNDSLSLAGNLSGMVRFFRTAGGSTALSFEATPSMLWLADSAWYINEAVITYADSTVFVEKFVLNHENQYLYADGSVGREKDNLDITINNFNLANLNIFLEKDGYTFSGILTGNAHIKGILSSLKLNSEFEIDKLIINGEDLGKTVSSAQYNSDLQRIDLDGSMHRGVIKTISYKGYVSTKGDLNLHADLNKVRMKIIEPFVEGILSEVRGDISGMLDITGTTAKPLAEGKITVQKASFMVDYLQTRYNFTGDILINNSSFDINDLRLFDANGNYADINGKVSHHNFSDIGLSIQITPVNFLMLNTRASDNELFYGKAIATGIIDVTGSLDEIKLKINARTEKDTRFFIPLSSSSEVSEYSFITYVSSQSTQTITEEKPRVTGLSMDFNLNVTPDAEVQIIFDSKVGDVIRGMGNGNLRMLINTNGDFQLFGDYVIEQGDYLFTLQNVINKKFQIEKGGTIRWNGDPYEAMMDMKAIYKLKTSLYDLTGDSTGRVPVECILSMKNNLMQPEMSFSINLPESDPKAQGVISNLPPDEINKQVISLLVMNRFVTPENMKGGVAENRSSGNALGVTSSELLSNQLSHWLSQISKDFDIGVNYRPGDDITADELEVALSTQILNDRVIVNGNVGVGGQQHNTSSQFLGDFEVEVKVNRSGKLRVKGFTKSNESIIYDTSPYRQGLGIFYKEDFDSFPALMKRYWNAVFRRKSKAAGKAE